MSKDERNLDLLDAMPDALIDEIDTWTVTDVHRRYRWVGDELVSAFAERAKVADQLPHLERAYAELCATTRISFRHQAAADGRRVTQQELDDEATLAAGDTKFELDVAKEMKLALNQKIGALQTLAEILRSVNKDARLAEGSP